MIDFYFRSENNCYSEDQISKYHKVIFPHVLIIHEIFFVNIRFDFYFLT